MSVPRDWRWHGAPRPDLVTGIAPLAPTPAADDVPALLAEADAWCADPARALRSGIVPDLAHALRRALAERDAARAERDRLARRIRGVVAVANGARVVAPPDVPDDADHTGPCGWTSR